MLVHVSMNILFYLSDFKIRVLTSPNFVVCPFHLDEYDFDNSKSSSACREMKRKSVDPFNVSCPYVSQHTTNQHGSN